MVKKLMVLVALLAGLVLLGVAATGCSSSKPQVSTLEQELEAKDTQISDLEKQVQNQKTALEGAEAEAQAEKARAEAIAAEAAAQAQQSTSSQTSGSQTSGSGTYGAASGGQITPAEMPAGASPGECYARVLIPATYSTSTEQVLTKEASHKLNVVPAQYEWVDQKVMVKEASESIEVVPAKFETKTERILVTPERAVWKKGRGPIEKVDNATGEIMCLVTEPAVYETISKKVMTAPASTRKVAIPAEYETVRVRKLVKPTSETREEIPASYTTVTKRVMDTSSQLEWQPVMCETNITRDVVTSIQRALKQAGHDPGPIDGRYGPLTERAVQSFQQQKNLATGGLTYETLSALGLRPASAI